MFLGSKQKPSMRNSVTDHSDHEEPPEDSD